MPFAVDTAFNAIFIEDKFTRDFCESVARRFEYLINLVCVLSFEFVNDFTLHRHLLNDLLAGRNNHRFTGADFLLGFPLGFRGANCGHEKSAPGHALFKLRV